MTDPPALTARETEILRLVALGHRNKDMARELNLSVRTIESHRFNLRRKTRAGRKPELIALARAMGLAPEEASP